MPYSSCATISADVVALADIDRDISAFEPTGSHGLSAGQITCLRLVSDNMTSKEIARTLGISPYTVDQRLDAARRKLGATSRKEAARLFATMEQGAAVAPLSLQSNPAAPTAAEAAPQAEAPLLSWSDLIPPVGGPRHNLSKVEVLSRSVNVAFFSMLLVAMLALVVTGSMRLLS